jgi:hypothetical protein
MLSANDLEEQKRLAGQNAVLSSAQQKKLAGRMKEKENQRKSMLEGFDAGQGGKEYSDDASGAKTVSSIDKDGISKLEEKHAQKKDYLEMSDLQEDKSDKKKPSGNSNVFDKLAGIASGDDDSSKDDNSSKDIVSNDSKDSSRDSNSSSRDSNSSSRDSNSSSKDSSRDSNSSSKDSASNATTKTSDNTSTNSSNDSKYSSIDSSKHSSKGRVVHKKKGKSKSFEALENISEGKDAGITVDESSLAKNIAGLSGKSEEHISTLLNAENINNKAPELFKGLDKDQLTSDVFKNIISGLVKDNKISKESVSSILFEYIDKGVLSKRDVARIMSELGLV